MRTVLVTGATGAIGSVLTRYLLEEEDTQVRLLLRATSAAHLEERLRDLMLFWSVDPEARSITARVRALAGDVTHPRLGLDESTYERLAGEVTHVIHSAGNVKLNRPLDEARRSAVDSTRHIVSFVDACRARASVFHKLEFVSTVGVAGRLLGVVPERAFGKPRTFRNTYEEAKAEAEAVLLQEMARGLPATIHRPSMVVGDSTTGRIIQFQVFYHLCEFVSGRRTAGIIPDVGDVRLDIIPVDYVARAIQLSSMRPDAANRIFHLCAGPDHAPRISDLAVHVREFFVSHGRTAPSLHQIPPAVMRTLLPVASRLTSGNLRRALQSLPYFLEYLDEAQVFDNASTDAYFSAAGLKTPALEAYLDVVLAYYLSRENLSRETGPAERAVEPVSRNVA